MTISFIGVATALLLYISLCAIMVFNPKAVFKSKQRIITYFTLLFSTLLYIVGYWYFQ